MPNRVHIVFEEDGRDPDQWSGAIIEDSNQPGHKFAVTNKLSARTVYAETWEEAQGIAFEFMFNTVSGGVPDG